MKTLKMVSIGSLLIVLFICFIAGVMFGGPRYSVWSSAQDGKAQLAKANYNRQIAVKEALAKEESAADLAKAEIIRAQGVAKANKIIGQSLKNNEAYLRYLWLQTLENQNNKVIYVPTEANLPVLEAGKR